MGSRRRSTTTRHLDLMQQGVNGSNTGSNHTQFDEIEVAPIFSSRVRNILKESNVFSQYGFLGVQQAIYNEDDSKGKGKEEFDERDKLMYSNMNAPWSAFICGSQGGGKSHTLSCLLENSLLSQSVASVLPNPLTGIVFHYDKFTSHSSTQLCEAAYLCSSGIPVRVLVSPTNIWAMEKLYQNLPGLPKGAPKPQVLPLRFKERQLNCSNLKTLMAVKEGAQTPLYLAVLNQLLRDIAVERAGEPGIDYRDFKTRLGEQGFTEAQNVPLNMRLQLLESFLDLSRPTKTRFPGASSGSTSDIWRFEKGSLTIVDLSCPFVSEDEACALFSICLGLFLENRVEGGRIVALDEAHKFLTKSGEAEIFTNQLLSIIRQQRHLGTRVLIATQEPTLSPSLIDLCNVTIVHRFLSPAWFSVLQDHLAGAARKSSKARDQIFQSIVQLRTGEALLFSPTSILDVVFEEVEGAKPNIKFVTLNASYIKLQIRTRITADGGKSIMASNTLSNINSGKDSAVDDLASAIGAANISTVIPSSVSGKNGNHVPLSFGEPVGFTSGQSVINQSRHTNPNPQATKISSMQLSPLTPPAAAPSEPSPKHKKTGKRAEDSWESALRTAVADLYAQDSTALDFGMARMAAAQSLSLSREFFNDTEWKLRSKDVLKDEVENQVAKSGLPPPGNATWMSWHSQKKSK